MHQGDYATPLPANEPVKSYAPGSPERAELKAKLAEMKGQQHEIPIVIGGKAIHTDKRTEVRPPHETAHLLGTCSMASRDQIQQAVDAALAARPAWEAMRWEDRAAIFLKAADLLAGPYRAAINAATMLGQSKNAFQAEIDAACELIDFLRFNVHFLGDIYQQQPASAPGIHNRTEWRGLEGFVLAITPFNFTAIGGNLAAAPAMCGNTIVWKPATTQVLSAWVIMQVLKEAGLPDGVINFVPAEGRDIGEICLTHRDLAGVHFTGSTGTFNHFWKTIGGNMANYRTYPRIVGETGGKDFVLAHPSADPDVVATALLRGAYEYQGQKCSAASRAYLPSNLFDAVVAKMKAEMAQMKMGSVEDFSCFINAVIDEKSFTSIAGYIDGAIADPDVEVLAGGKYDSSQGWFVEPTLLHSQNPKSTTMCEEIFGPVLTVYRYDEADFDGALELVDTTSPYALTGAVISRDREAIRHATDRLRHVAGNFYINDKPTGAVVGQQPFGGARASGTNDKAGSALNLYRWLSARTVKETFVPPTDWRYPFLGAE
jgi:1-pyrroline-5-carboxylate dehydrogenase